MPSNQQTDSVIRRMARCLPSDLFSDYKWWRQLIGGRWERWWIDCVHAHIWMLVSPTEGDDYRPPLGRGRPIMENWP